MAFALPRRPSHGAPSVHSERRPSIISVPSAKRSLSPPREHDAQLPMHPKPTNGISSHHGPAIPSHQLSAIKRKRKVRPQYPADSGEKHVEYILVASFDIDRGSTMEHQYPAPIGGDEHMLAELMLPEGTHARSQDWTMFFLHKDTSDADQALQERKEERRRRKELKAPTATGTNPSERNTAKGDAEDSDDDSEAEEDEDLKSIEGPPLVYVLNLVNTKQDNTVRRGAVVKAMAICTRHSFLHIYKPLLLLGLEEYFRTPVPETLASLYEAVNSMDLSLLPKLSLSERLILQGSDVKDLFIEKFEAMIQERMRISAATRSEVVTSPLQARQRYGLPRDTHELDSVVAYNKVPVPVKIPTAVSSETVGDFSLIQLITTFNSPHASTPQAFQTLHPHLTTSGPFTHPIIVLVNALLSQKRIVFIGHNMPSSNVAEAVLAACALSSGGLLRGFVRHAFPYTDLTKIDDLLKVPGFIAGVTNPTFALHEEWWDVLCDLPTGRIKISPKIAQAPLTEGVLFFQHPSQYSVLAQSTGLDQKSIGAIVTAGAALSAGIGGSNTPTSSGVGDPTGDNAFMASVMQAIAERRGEAAIRAKFRLWVNKFTRLAAAFEEMVYGASALQIQGDVASPISNQGSPALSQNGFPKLQQGPDPAVTGYGYVWPSAADKIRELAANATRIEGWIKTRSYYNFIQDLAVYVSHRAVKDFDLQHLYDKLTKLRLGPESSGAIYVAISNAVRTYEEINQLLVVVVNTSPHSPTAGPQGWGHGGSAAGGGGLFYLALGLFHPRSEVREAVAECLARIREHEAGRHFWGKLGGFERAAWARVMTARREREEA